MSESSVTTGTRSRRAVLSVAAGAAAAVAAGAVAPAAALAADPNDVVKNTDNATLALTSITQGTTDVGAFGASGKGIGPGLIGTTDGTTLAAIVGLAGSPEDSVYQTLPFEIDAGVYGFANQTFASAGVFGDGPIGVYGYGDGAGVWADGIESGLIATARPSGTAVHAHAGTGAVPAVATNVALRGTVSGPSQIGIHAAGRVVFPSRSGRVTFSAGQASRVVNVAGMAASNIAVAVLNTNRAGVWVRAVVPAAGKITIVLNKKAPGATSVAWLVLG